MTTRDDLWLSGALLHSLIKYCWEELLFILILGFPLIGALIPRLNPKARRRPYYKWSTKTVEVPNSARAQDLRSLKDRHEAASALVELFDKDGAGAWPPKATHDSWPLALRPFKDIYIELVPLLPAAEPSLDDNVNNVRREHYRSLMRKLLAERVDIKQVQSILAAVEAGNWDIFPRDAYNGFYCAVAVCRHAYR